ncbi:uncharacterized protein LOC117292690 [Asterias rubens]|uniref:uncharacterized protein LOC117292690 n=1 Tax=Asterias rubens TaxID=7604 RepID=UPI001454EC5F|nr:uncharacterized protein LOC117292690 [Asterias rubens]
MEQQGLSKLADGYKKHIAGEMKGYETLRNLDLVVVDNSLRESTVAQLRGHTLQNKWKIYEEVKKCGFNYTIVASFSHMTRVDDVFVQELCAKEKQNRSGLLSFSELVDGSVVMKKGKDHQVDIPDEYLTAVPIGLQKLKSYGVPNAIIEIDLNDGVYNFNLAKFPLEGFCHLLETRIKWCHKNLDPNSQVFVNIRDLAEIMPKDPERVFQVVAFLAKLPTEIRPAGVLFEEPEGKTLPEECGAWTKYIRQVMKDNGWNGHLLVHIHERYGFTEASVMQSLMNGANGIWASVCTEGAFMGHASTCGTIMNLVRFGNTKVLKKFNCKYLRKAAINVTRLTTGKDPAPKQPFYGGRALDYVFSMTCSQFDLADFFGEKPLIRISTLASDKMICAQLENYFGKDEAFTIEQAHKMKAVMLEDLQANRKEEYMSAVGLAVLFDRAGGSLNKVMLGAIDKMQLKSRHAQNLLAEVRKMWDVWDLKDGEKDDMLEYDSFYNGFMAQFFGCYKCTDTKKALKAIDMDADGLVDWNEFAVYLKWAIHQYPETKDAEELLDIAFRKGIIPAMHDEVLGANS